jgi:hypothetical protein
MMMARITFSQERLDRLRNFRRRTWSVVAACLVLRIAGGSLGIQASTPVEAAEDSAVCPVHLENFS